MTAKNRIRGPGIIFFMQQIIFYTFGQPEKPDG